MRLVLASSSKQRQDIFKSIGWKYEVVKSLVEEESDASDPCEYVKNLSKDKANSAADQIKEKALIVSADTVIYMDGKIYEKPKNKEEAFENMKEMSGKNTHVVTGVTIKDLYKNKEITFADKVEVIIKNITDEEIRWYVENEKELLNRSGYAILNKAAIFIEKIDGDFNTAFGISPSKLWDKFRELGYKLSDFELE